MNDTEKGMVVVMIDKRIGKRIKQCRERLGLTQEEFAEKTGFTANYISTLERGASFPRCENLILLLNALEVSADAIFCDVLDHTTEYKATQLSNELGLSLIHISSINTSYWQSHFYAFGRPNY